MTNETVVRILINIYVRAVYTFSYESMMNLWSFSKIFINFSVSVGQQVNE